ncbi:MAG TPA: NAD(P)-dependent oxidoreductase [Chitinophagaceae bacterium]|nr:NAD(P)-dependent oxidoreductase [Chitinophagaceae bacterium]
MKAFLGMGLLGSNFTRALLQKGSKVQVWNRTAAKAKDLEQYGAIAFETPAEAVKDADIVHITLKDDAAVDEVLAKAKGGLMPGAIIIDHTTTSVQGAVDRTRRWKEKGFMYQHAPVFMGPQNALQATGFMLVSGDQQLINRLKPELTPMTGKLINFGEEAGKAAAMKLLGNSFLVVFTAGIADTLTLAKALKIPSGDLLTLFGEWNPGSSLPARLKGMASGNYDSPSWELNMARKDTGLFMEEAKNGGTALNVIPTIATVMDAWIAKGFGNKDWTVIGKDAVQVTG